ncbi:MAG: sulfatase [Spirochaetaceae bacterium]|nr:MAG: sulfatase [Spirochaetaceae bacterium]
MKTTPNIVFILTDDQGPWALGCAGNDEILTPNLDRLAAGGTRFDNFFCASPVCSPARASILTGRIPSQHGVHDWIRRGSMDSSLTPGSGWGDDCGIEYLAGLPAYTEHLANAGYVCGISGKWHLGDSMQPQKGFSYWNLFPYGGGEYYGPWMLRDGKMEREPNDRYLTDVITDGALRFLDERSTAVAGDQQTHDARQPFYLSVHYTAPHSPWQAGQHPSDLVDLYADCAFESCPDVPGGHPWQINSAPRGTGEKRLELLRGYFAAVSGVDRGVGLILEKLSAMGELENTLVIFTSDNGMNMGHHGIWGKGNGTFPQNMYDTSVKVPMIVSRPGHVPAGVLDSSLRSHYDIYPTLLEYLGLPNPEADELPGTSFAPLLQRGNSTASPSGDENGHVVVFDEYGPVRMIRSRDWKYVHRYPYGPNELYDLVGDPGETKNLIEEGADHPEAVRLRAELERWFLRYADPKRDGAKQPVTGKGQLDLAGIPGEGRRAFDEDWWYIRDDGERIPGRHFAAGRVTG